MTILTNIKKQYRYLAVVLALTGCATSTESAVPTSALQSDKAQQEAVEYQVDPETFSLSFSQGEEIIPVSLPETKRQVKDLKKDGETTSWVYPDEKIAVSVRPEAEYLNVSLTSLAETDQEFSWPVLASEMYYMPLGEGKRIPADDPAWVSYMRGQEISVLEQLSMPFWVSVYGEHSVLYIMEHPYRSELVVSDQDAIRFSVLNQYPAIDQEKEKSFRIYLTDRDPVSAAKIYRQYVKEQGRFVTLEEKAEANPNIRKLYGAPHIYLSGEYVIEPENINWPAFRNSLNTGLTQYIASLASDTETGEEALQSIEEIKNQDYVAQYQKQVICRYLSEVLKKRNFYDPGIFTEQDEFMTEILQNGIERADESALIQFNKHALAANMPEAFQPADQWMDSSTMDLVKDLKANGIDQAWIGLHSWEQAYAKPELVTSAVEKGYLIGPYDSYHSIHEPGKEQWITAGFSDTTLYDNAAVMKQDGEWETGFKQVGRKLNPTLSLPAVKQRTQTILSTGIPFNSWFIDCDATGEIYDDYDPQHRTTQQEDLKARLERMAYIRDNHNMVIGSEGGNDFAASTIAFAHGIELKTFSWMDEDMKSNRDSEYYIGKYYSATGGVPEHFSKRIPIKEQYYTIFVDPRYDLPLFKLVYHDSVITTYHWDWSTFKIKGAVKERMLREVLYNVPPLYHLDRAEWEHYKEDISKHTEVWSEFSKKAIIEEMTDFEYLTSDGSVQKCEYGKSQAVVANFGQEPFEYEGREIPALSLLLETESGTSIYTPDVTEE